MPVALVTGVGRSLGIGASVTAALRADGWRVLTTGWRGYDRRMPWDADDVALADIEADLADPGTPDSQFTGAPGSGRVVAITSDHTAFNLPYGASKGAMDRIVLAAAVELASSGIAANVVNPGATDTGWMDTATETEVRARNLQSRVGTPADCANLVRFLCSPAGQWINGQVLHSDGGLHH